MTSNKFYINDIELNVAPTDITAREDRAVSSRSFLRDNGNYSFMSKFAKTVYSVSITFDLNNPSDVSNLSRLSAQLNKYPFVFIKSKKLKEYISQTSSMGTDYQIFGIRRHSYLMHKDINGALVLDLEMSYFNHIPFIKDFSFVDIQKKESVSNSPFSKDKDVEDEYSFSGVDSPQKSLLFREFFKGEVSRANISSLKYASNPNHISMRYPVFLEEKPESNVDVEEVTYVSPKADENGNKTSETFWILWVPLVAGLSDDNINSSGICVESIRVIVENNFAEHNLSGWTYPILQYMGKNSSYLEMSIVADSSGSIGSSAVTKMKMATNAMDINFGNYRRYNAWNTLKIDSFITDVIDSSGFIIDDESVSTSSSSNGTDVIHYRMAESNVKPLMEYSRYNNAGNRDSDFTDDEMIEYVNKLLTKADTAIREKKFSHAVKDIGIAVDSFTDATMLGLKKFASRTTAGLLTVEDIDSMSKSVSDFVNNSEFSQSSKEWVIQRFPATLQALESAKSSISKGLTITGDSVVNSLDLVNMAMMKDEGIETSFFEDMIYGASQTGADISEFILGTVNTVADFAFGGDVSQEVNIGDVRPAYYLLIKSVESFNDKVSNIYEDVEETGDAFLDAKAFMNEMKSRPDISATKFLEDLFYELIKSSGSGYINRLMGSESEAIVSKFVENYNSSSNDIPGDAISDLSLSSSLTSITLADGSVVPIEKMGIMNPQDASPFFFLRQRNFLKYEDFKRVYDVVNGFSKDESVDKINSIRDKEGESIQSANLKATEPDFSDIRNEDAFINEGLKNGFQPVFEGDPRLDMGEIDPFSEDDQVPFHLREMARPLSFGMDKAFPVIKVYIVVGEETDLVQSFRVKEHNYYEVKGINSARVVTANDDNPSDVLLMEISNPGSIYTDKHVRNSTSRPKVDPSKIDTSEEEKIEFDQLMIKPGTKLHVRAGYGNNINELETVFNGIITESGGENTLSIIAEGYGRELVSFLHGDDPSESQFFMNANTRSILSNVLYSDEIEHFGNMIFSARDADPESRRVRGYGFKTRLFTNLYIDDIEDVDDEFDSELINILGLLPGNKQSTYQFPMYKSTPFSMLKEMEYRHPGTFSSPMIYGDRMTYFFGIKEQLYIHRDLASQIMLESPLGYNIWSDKTQSLYNKIRNLRFRPACKFHLITSSNDIISNGMMATDDFNTVLNVQYYGDNDDLADGDVDYLEMKADDNLRPGSHRSGYLEMMGTHGKYQAYRYGMVGLRRELEKMYAGKIIIVGNAAIRAGDFVSINDALRGIYGTVKVRECIHHIDSDVGFVTEIVPSLYCEGSKFQYSDLFPKLAATGSRCADIIDAVSVIMNQANVDYLENRFMQDLLEVQNRSSNSFISEYLPDTEALQSLAIDTASVTIPVLVTDLLTSKGNGLRTAKLSKKLVEVSRTYATSASNLIKMGEVSKIGQSLVSGLKGFKPNPGLFGKAYSIGGQLIKFGWGAGKAIFSFVRMMTPIGWAATIVMNVLSETYEGYTYTRQPVRIFPVQLNGESYVAGLKGFVDNGPIDSIILEAEKTGEAISDISDYIWTGVLSR